MWRSIKETREASTVGLVPSVKMIEEPHLKLKIVQSVRLGQTSGARQGGLKPLAGAEVQTKPTTLKPFVKSSGAQKLGLAWVACDGI